MTCLLTEQRNLFHLAQPETLTREDFRHVDLNVAQRLFEKKTFFRTAPEEWRVVQHCWLRWLTKSENVNSQRLYKGFESEIRSHLKNKRVVIQNGVITPTEKGRAFVNQTLQWFDSLSYPEYEKLRASLLNILGKKFTVSTVTGNLEDQLQSFFCDLIAKDKLCKMLVAGKPIKTSNLANFASRHLIDLFRKAGSDAHLREYTGAVTSTEVRSSKAREKRLKPVYNEAGVCIQTPPKRQFDDLPQKCAPSTDTQVQISDLSLSPESLVGSQTMEATLMEFLHITLDVYPPRFFSRDEWKAYFEKYMKSEIYLNSVPNLEREWSLMRKWVKNNYKPQFLEA
jgi:hypothetical protein